MTHTATYSPEDNKLRLYPAHRLDKEEYDRVKAHGFKWAPKQELFVAPMWTPSREDFLIEMCGEIGDEDKSLVERQEERAERFENYSDRRAQDADIARKAVSAIADNIPLGQPILVGHHSEKHARKDAEKIESGMRKAVKMWKQSNYWKDRAKGAIRHAKYKELPSVRARRIKGLEADLRKQNKNKQEAEMWLKLWTKCAEEQDKELQKQAALRIAGMCWLHLPRKEGDREDFDQTPTAYSALNGDYPTLYAPRTVEEVYTHALAVFPRNIAHYERWIEHYTNRLEYEREMLADSGGTVTDKKGPEVGGAIRYWGSPGYGQGWNYIKKVNQISVTVEGRHDYSTRNYRTTVEFDKIKAVLTRDEVEAAREAGRIQEKDEHNWGFYLMESREQFDAREAVTVEPAPGEPDQPAPIERPTLDAADFQALQETLKAGVKVVTAPQLFPTPPELAARMVEAADLRLSHEVLEPSAGTGAITSQILHNYQVARLVAVEKNLSLVDALRGAYGFEDRTSNRVIGADFLECNGNLGTFDRIIMNPPFENAADVKHILHAWHMLKPGGRLVAICANGPRQNQQLKPLVDENGGDWEELPEGTFKESGTGVRTVLLTIDKPHTMKQAEQVSLF